MSFIINKRGERVNVDMDVDWFSQTVPIYADDAELFEHYLVNLYKNDNLSGGNSLELIKQEEFKKYPTKDEIMYVMWKNGLSRYDVVTIEKGFVLDWNDRP